VILDTGSGVCAFPCASCRHCGRHIDPAFDFARSSTARWTPCGGECRGRCTQGHCGYYQGYTEGSSISGYWFQDMVRLGDTIQRNPPVMGRMGCHQNENNLFYTQKANGIMGVGPNARLLQTLFEDRPHVQTRTFSICLAEWGGQLVVGGHNATYHIEPLQYVPLTTMTGFYGVPLSGMSVNGQVFATRFGRTMVDSGTTYTYMASSTYRSLRAAIENHCRGRGCGGAQLHGNCWTLPGLDALQQFPEVMCHFGDVRIKWVAKAYLYRKSSSKSYCYAFEDDGANANTVLGASWMLHNDAVFDMVHMRFGMAPSRCPQFRDRPPHRPDANLEPPTTPLPASQNLATTSLAPSSGSAAVISMLSSSSPAAPGPSTTSAMQEINQWPADSSTSPQSRLPSGSSVLQGDVVRLAAIGALSLAALCMCFVCRWLYRQRDHKYVQHKEEEEVGLQPGMPPQIVGASGAGPEHFVIGDDADQGNSSDEGFEYVDNVDVEPQSARRRHDSAPEQNKRMKGAANISPGGLADDEDPWNDEGNPSHGVRISGPIFSGPPGTSSAHGLDGALK